MPKIRWTILIWAIPAMICLGHAIDIGSEWIRYLLISGTVIFIIMAAREDREYERIADSIKDVE